MHFLAQALFFASALQFLDRMLLHPFRGVNGQLSTSLYIPGFDAQPVSADIVGVGSDGRTTWALHKGKPDATDTSSYPDFIGTATLVQGPNDVSLTYANTRAQFTIGQRCTISESTLAICTIVAQGSTATQTEVVTHIPIQGGAPLAGPTATLTTGTTKASDPSSVVSSSSQTVVFPMNSNSPNSSVGKHSLRSVQSHIIVCGTTAIFLLALLGHV